MIYAAQGTKGTTAQTALTLVSTANGRPRIIEYKLSNVGAVTVDSQFEVQVKRFTVAGTTTSVTPSSDQSFGSGGLAVHGGFQRHCRAHLHGGRGHRRHGRESAWYLPLDGL